MKRWRDRCSLICGAMAAAFLSAMLLITVADVTLRAVVNWPIRGVYEVVELLLAATFFLALPCVFLRDENILVNAIDDVAPRLVPPLKRAAAVLAVVVLAVMAWQGLIAARDSLEFNDVTADLALPRFWHWLALLFGVIASAIAALVMALAREDAR
ncbi:MAG: TRAP transporter small permease subunit [Xanthobacteraceae bacterium]|nr:TRAP transporter small permease subunit [Xanthobacteraceae bacterium]